MSWWIWVVLEEGWSWLNIKKVELDFEVSINKAT